MPGDLDYDEQSREEYVGSLTRSGGLKTVLRKHHITGIAISGTIGIGLFINSGEIIALSGGPGAVIAYFVAGSIVISVMLCLSEMVSMTPIPGAMFEFPNVYYDRALGFACGWAYWLAYTCSCCTLTVQTAMLLEYWNVNVVGGIFICLVPIALINSIWSVKFYGWVEWTFKWLKQLFVLFLFILMIVIAAGKRGARFSDLPFSSRILSPAQNMQFAPGLCFAGWHNCTGVDANIKPGDYLQAPHGFGTFMGVWTSITVASFAFLGVEIVLITAGEARYPRADLPIASRWIGGFAFVVYLLLAIVASINVSYNDSLLISYSAYATPYVSGDDIPLFRGAEKGTITTGIRSPFLIAVVRSGFDEGLQSFLHICFFFASLTAANTAFYVSSRTFYLLTTKTTVPWIRDRIMTTSFDGFPLYAVLVTVLLSFFSFLAVIHGHQGQIVGVVSRISVTCILCVYVSECVTFCRYLRGMNRRNNLRNYRKFFNDNHLFRSPGHQPAPAIYAIVACSLLLLFNGWDTFYLAHHKRLTHGQIAAGLIRAYVGPLFFLGLYLGYKIRYKANMRDFETFPIPFVGMFDDRSDRDRYGGTPSKSPSRVLQILAEML